MVAPSSVPQASLRRVCVKAGAAAAVASNRHLLGSFLYCCALNHKQMALYYAPAFFGHLLGCCLQRPSALNKVGMSGLAGNSVKLVHLLGLESQAGGTVLSASLHRASARVLPAAP